MHIFNKFYPFVEHLAEKVHNLGSDSLKIALCPTGNPPILTNSQLSDLNTLSTVNLDDVSLTVNSSSQTNGLYKLDVANKTITNTGSATGPFQYIVVYNDTPTSPVDPLIGYYDYGTGVTLSTNESMVINFDSTYGLLSIGVTGGSSTGISTLSLSLASSRTSGVAPLYVFFGATGTTSTGVSRPFHYIGYDWNFDDPTSMQPNAKGGVSAHVYDQPGTYTVTLSGRNQNGDTATITQDIVVFDPEVVFTGTNTVCFSNDADFTDSPFGATQVTTNLLSTVLTHAGNGKRLLLKRGHTFISSGNPEVTITTGPAHFGAFGSGISGDARGIYANNPIISVQPGVNEVFGFAWIGNDVRCCDINMVEGDLFASGCIGFDTHGTCVNSLLYRCSTSGFRTSMGYSHDTIEALGHSANEACSIVQCHFKDSHVTTTYCGGRGLGFINNYYDANDLSHLCRITFAQGCVVDGNLFEYPGTNRHCVKLHAAQNTGIYGVYSENVVVRNNTMRAGVPWMITCGAQDAISNELIRDVLIEQNLFLADAGSQSPVFIHCSNVTARNNLIVTVNGNGGIGSYAGFLVDENGITPYPSGIEIYNNTQYDHTAGGNETAILDIRKYATGETLLLYNNILDVDAGNSWVVYPNLPVSSQVDSQSNLHNLTFNFTNPATYDFTPGAGSAALGAGIEIYNFYDISGNVRSHNDVGAFERAS